MKTLKTKFYGFIYIIVIVLLLGFSIFYLPFYGFSFPPSDQRELEVNLQENLKDKTIIFNMPASIINGRHPNINTKTYQEITKEIVPDSHLDSLWWYERNNQTVSPLPEGKQFKFTKEFYWKPIGLSAIDSGSDWRKLFVITDEQNNDYIIWCISLGTDITQTPRRNFTNIDSSILDCHKQP